MRACGSCTLCCKLVPVEEIGKPAGQRCPAQRHGGCTVYRRPNFPMSCHAWSCRWLTNDDAADLRRPDRAHYVIDMMPDYVRATDDGTGESATFPVVQIWCDPNHPDAHRDPALRAWLERKAAVLPLFGLVRYGNGAALCLIPPSMTAGGVWIEQSSRMHVEPAHSRADIAKVLSQGNPDLPDSPVNFG